MNLREWLLKILGCKEEHWEAMYYAKELALIQCQDQNKPWDVGEKPTWLNDTIKPYEPTVEVEGEKVTLEPNDIYMECPTLRAVATKWRELTLNEKLWEIWKYVITQVSYEYDKSENWQIPIVTLERSGGRGDCEDTCILFLTLARIAHVPADRIFNATGWVKTSSQKYGHSFPIVKMLDDKWYIMESTLNSIPSSPKLFKGSNYDCSWGVANWKYYGKLFKGDQL